jgi:hypothetical protein
MLVLITVENGVKKIIPLTADAGAGNPVGTVIVVCSNQIPSNYLPLGTQYDTSLYPVLYALLGTDTTPTASALGLPTLTSGQYAIKATSGLSENAQDNVINTLNEQRSYSTEEVNTGKKWIDGKPIYRQTFNIGNLPNNTAKVINFSIQNLNDIVKVEGIANTTNIVLPIPYTSPDNTERISVYIAKVWGNITVNTISDMSSYYGCVTIEYTKTTD